MGLSCFKLAILQIDRKCIYVTVPVNSFEGVVTDVADGDSWLFGFYDRTLLVSEYSNFLFASRPSHLLVPNNIANSDPVRARPKKHDIPSILKEL
jgi:hypothetical protein